MSNHAEAVVKEEEFSRKDPEKDELLIQLDKSIEDVKKGRIRRVY